MSKFDELINNLKRDIQSLPSVDGSKRECVNVPTSIEEVVMASPPSIQQEYMMEEPSTRKSKYVKLFVRHGLLSVEFFLFFFILLSITKPSFLYYSERVYQNGRELLRTHFSFLYLVSYSLFFTCIFHVLIMIHKDLVKRY